MEASDVDPTAHHSQVLNVANLVSALRLPIAAAFFVVDGLLWRGLLLSLGALSDALDGWLARRLALESRVGALIDPLFDKIFVIVALAAFLSGPFLGWREFVVLLSRDFLVGIGFLVVKVMGLNIAAESRRSGKLVTVLQVVTLFVLLLAPYRTGAFIVAVAVASAIAVVDYAASALAEIRGPSAAA